MQANLPNLEWLWMWFVIGELIYILKRGYYLITGPSPVANSWGEFIQRCWAPLIVRGVVGGGVYWATFYPEIISAATKFFGWNTDFHSVFPHYAPMALFFGLGVDNLLDFGISKIPYLRDWLPQMPPPLVRSQIANPPAPADRKQEGV